MRLSNKQLQSYQRDGFLLLPEYFSGEEVELMKWQLPALFAEDSDRRVLEKGSDLVRSVYGSHEIDEVFHCLVRHPRLLTSEAPQGPQPRIYPFDRIHADGGSIQR